MHLGQDGKKLLQCSDKDVTSSDKRTAFSSVQVAKRLEDVSWTRMLYWLECHSHGSA